MERVDANKGKTGVSIVEYLKSKGGVPKNAPNTIMNRGIPTSGVFDMPYTPDRCEAVTKEGEPCRARPVKSGHLCVGHLRQVEKQHAEK